MQDFHFFKIGGGDTPQVAWDATSGEGHKTLKCPARIDSAAGGDISPLGRLASWPDISHNPLIRVIHLHRADLQMGHSISPCSIELRCWVPGFCSSGIIVERKKVSKYLCLVY